MKVDYREEAELDLENMYDWISEVSGPSRAEAQIHRIVSFCDGLGVLPERGRLQPNLGPQVRTMTYKSSVVVSYVIATDSVVILRIYGRGRNIG